MPSIKIPNGSGGWIKLPTIKGDTGPSGDGSGNMVASMYDPNEHRADVFNRSHHTGTQLASTISDFSSAVSGSVGVLNVKSYGAKGDGSTDDTTAIQSAHDAILNSDYGKGILSFPPGDYRITSTLNIDVNKVIVECNGATITSDGASVAIQLVNSFDYSYAEGDVWAFSNSYNGIYGQSYLGFKNLHLRWKSGSDATGIKFYSTTTTSLDGIAMVQFNNCDIQGFPKCLEFSGHTWNCVFSGGAITGNKCIYIPSGGTDYFERICFNGMTFGGYYQDTDIIVDINQPSGFLSFEGCSFDYSQVMFDISNSSTVYCSHCHFETNVYEDYWIKISGDGASLTIRDSNIDSQGTITHPLFYVDSNVLEGGLFLENVMIKGSYGDATKIAAYAAAYPAFNLVEGLAVRVKNICEYSGAVEANVGLGSNVLPSWSFEGTHGFTLTGGAAVNTTEHHTGATSLKIVNGSTSKFNIIGLIGNQRPKLSFWSKSAVGVEAYGVLKAYTADNILLGTEWSAVTATGNGAWQFSFAYPLDRLPMATNRLELSFVSNGDAFIDDVVLNVV